MNERRVSTTRPIYDQEPLVNVKYLKNLLSKTSPWSNIVKEKIIERVEQNQSCLKIL